MSRKTLSQGFVAVALAAFLTLASAAPTLAATRSSGQRGVQAPATVWGFVLDVAVHFSHWFGRSGLLDKALPSSQDTADFVAGSDPNGIEVSTDPTDPAPLYSHSGH